MLHVAVLLERCHIYASLSDSRPPAVICEVNSVAKPLNASLKDVIVDILDVQFKLHFGDELLDLAVSLRRVSFAWT